MPKFINVDHIQLEPDPVENIMNGVLLVGRSQGKTIKMVQGILKAMINNIPAADVVSVVRCKDCKYWATEDDEGYCNNPAGLDDISNADDLCSYGERKEKDYV